MESREPNRLIHEKSPYLLQHAYNPVEWYAWGEEAFEKARREDKPIFLSIGYATCHWCHVMERESFEDQTIADFLNEHFVSIKVDREERPDIDGIYMDAVQAMTGRGGWPLSAMLVHDGKPFFTGTYYPPDTFLELLRRASALWKEERDALERQAATVAEHLQKISAGVEGKQALQAAVTDAAYSWYERSYDTRHGGFGGAPKFPRTSSLDFLLRYWKRTGKDDALSIVTGTLDHMIRGGIHDHLGGGFHRYSTDREWHLPHFEKMLYDQSLIARTLVDAYRATGHERYLEAARGTLDYLLRRMQSDEGGFFSAEDADTEGKEGLTYVWTREEVLAVLGEERGEVFARYYGVRAGGNYEEERPDPSGGEPLNVLDIAFAGGVKDLAEELGRPEDELERQLREDREKLFAVREKRAQPFLDDKVLVEWNGLAISAFAHAYQASGDARYLEAARGAAAFILDRMVEDGLLQRRYRDGEVAVPGFLEDYAFFTEGLLDLYESDFDSRWLEAAVSLGREMVEHFWDEESGGFFSTSDRHEELIARRKEFYDGAVPSGNSTAFLDLLRLGEMTGSDEFARPAEELGKVAAALTESSPPSHPQLLCGVEFVLQKPLEIAVVGPLGEGRTQDFLRRIRGGFLPAKVVVHAPSGEEAERLAKLVPLLEAKVALGGDPTVYVCRDRVCKQPASDLETLEEQLTSEGTGG